MICRLCQPVCSLYFSHHVLILILTMASTIFSYLHNIWPFSLLKEDDLKTSIQLVNRLSVPEQTKQFVFAIRDSDSGTVVYILAAQSLSEQSAIDADHLIKATQPDAVVVSVAPSALPEIEVEKKLFDESQVNQIPTSYLGVLKRCVLDKVKKEDFDVFAGFQVVQAIFGIGFYGHFLAARRAAEKFDSHFILLESPFESSLSMNTSTHSEDSGIPLRANNLLPGKVISSMYSRRICIADTIQSNVVKSLGSPLSLLDSTSNSDSDVQEVEESMLGSNYNVPPFAESFYSLLADLYHIFRDIPAISKALFSAKKMLVDVSEGQPVDTENLSEVQNFRIAIEGLRMALNKAGRNPIDKSEKENFRAKEFAELPFEEKCHALFTQALKRHAEKFETVVAIVDATSLAGLRRHWNTLVPSELSDLAYCNNDPDNLEAIWSDQIDKRRILADKPIVALGAGATAVVGASSLSKVIPASHLIKVATFQLPASLKLGLIQLQRTASVGLSKILVPSKLLAPGLTTGTKSSALKLTASANDIRAAVHSMISTARRTSFFAIRTSFYEIMQRRHVRPTRFAPWATFGCSMGACAGLLMFGDGIECAVESVPTVPMIASLGRGLQSLQLASEEVKGTNSTKIHEAIQSMMHYLKKF
ncbi:hypothetical protein MA16_Dca000467 [Dendrobium catenatum]|uniref:Uncharacterized protein n=2 Tax=Dendrobium catenatum TaxID=906689 RepID=A0A2I0WU11_9ASPA|nr:hypothetical protein MA16_Dca000467 [Dendrobium catenatum]